MRTPNLPVKKYCKECGRFIPFPVKGAINYCGFCVNPVDKDWIKQYFKWVKEHINIEEQL